ncbi:MAG: hypothetical protein HY791_25075 [Deltaproteobacteria bacterium]|nr:hypothetical protein [Deltaproteobacteria bacterium]
MSAELAVAPCSEAELRERGRSATEELAKHVLLPGVTFELVHATTEPTPRVDDCLDLHILEVEDMAIYPLGSPFHHAEKLGNESAALTRARGGIVDTVKPFYREVFGRALLGFEVRPAPVGGARSRMEMTVKVDGSRLSESQRSFAVSYGPRLVHPDLRVHISLDGKRFRRSVRAVESRRGSSRTVRGVVHESGLEPSANHAQ